MANKIGLALGIVCFVLTASPGHAAESKAVIYENLSLFDGTSDALKSGMAIVTQGARITAVVPQNALAGATPPKAQIVDLHGQFVIPGLINSHVHMATVPDPAYAKAYLRRDLYSGITAVRDMAGDARLLGEIAREAEFGEIPSPDIYYAALMAGPDFFKDPRVAQSSQGVAISTAPWMRAVTPQTDMRIAVAEARGTGATAIKIYADLPASMVDAITTEAHRQHMLVWAHAAVFPASPRQVADAGVDVMSHACMLGYQAAAKMPPAYHHRPPVTPAEVTGGRAVLDALLDDMKRRGTILDATLYVYDEMWRVPHANPPPYCTLALAEQIAAQAWRAGIPLSAGTDGDSSWKAPYSAIDDELALFVTKVGMTPAQAIRSATVNGARAVGQSANMGTIEKGKLANFVVLSKNPLADIRNLNSLTMTVKHGRIYKRNDYKPITKTESGGDM